MSLKSVFLFTLVCIAKCGGESTSSRPEPSVSSTLLSSETTEAGTQSTGTTVPASEERIAERTRLPPLESRLETTAVPEIQGGETISNCKGGFSQDYIRQKAEEATSALKAGQIKTANYFFAKVDDSPQAPSLLDHIIRENYTSELYNDTLDFIGSIFSSSLRVKGYDTLIDQIVHDEGNPNAKKDVLRLAHHLAAREPAFLPEDWETLISRFSNGVKAVVFSPFFAVKNIHDSYVLQFKQREGEHFIITGKCKHCSESKLVAVVDPVTGFYKILSKTLRDDGHPNCLGVKQNRVVFRTNANASQLERICNLELWQIRFVGKSMAMISYHPQSGREAEIDTDFQPGLNYTLQGYGITRTGFNKKVTLESPQYLSSYQMWLVN